MDYRGQDLDLRTSRWSASSTDPAGWRELSAPTAPPPSPRHAAPRSGPIWVDEAVLACANHAYDVALAYRSHEVRLEHLLLAMTRIESAAAALEARGVRVVSLRRDSAVAIAGEPPVGASEGATPRRSPELEDVLRIAASRTAHHGRPASIEDVVQVLCDVGGDLPGGDLIARHFPRPTREYWGSASRPHQQQQHLGSHLLEASDGESPLAVVAPQPAIDPAVVQTIFDRLADLERAFSERLFSLEQALARQPLPVSAQVDLHPIESRLAAIESALANRPLGEGVAAIDPAITDRLWAIEHAVGVERTERTSAVTQLSDEISGVRSAVRLAAQSSEQGHGNVAEQIQQLAGGLEQHRLEFASSIGDRIDGIEQALDGYERKASEAHAVYSAELAEVHDALMKIGSNQHTLAGAIDSWRNNGSGELHLINARIGAVHEDGAKRLAAIERLCADVDTLSQLVLEDRTPAKRSSFKHWLYGTEDWIRASWRRPLAKAQVPKPQAPKLQIAKPRGVKWHSVRSLRRVLWPSKDRSSAL